MNLYKYLILFTAVPFIVIGMHKRPAPEGSGSKKSVKKPIVEPAKTFTLVSSQGTRYQVPHEIALQSYTIQRALLGSGNAEVNEIHIAAPDAIVNALSQVMNIMHQHRQIFGEKLYQILDEETGIVTDAKLFLRAAVYLDFPQLVDYAIHNFTEELFEAELENPEAPRQIIATVAEMNPQIGYELGRNYFFKKQRMGQNYTSDYGFSIEDYLKYNRDAIYARINSTGKEFDLSSLRLNSLQGLNNIKGIESITHIKLNNNELPFIPDEILTRLSDLQVINLENNRISKISPESFSRLIHLKELHLRMNTLSKENKEELVRALPHVKIIF